MKFQTDLAISEAKANVRASPAISAGLALVALGIGFLVAWLPTAETAAIADDWTKQVAMGSSMVVVSAKNGGVDARFCDGLNAISGVEGAGGIYGRSPIALAQSDGGHVDALYVSAGFAAATWADPSSLMSASVIIPEELATLRGWTPNDDLVYREVGQRSGDTWMARRIDAVPPGRNRVGGVNDAVMFVSPPGGRVQSCYVSIEPDSFNLVRVAVTGLFGRDYFVRDFVEHSDTVRTPPEQMTGRFGYWSALVLGCFLSIIHLLVWFMRRGDFALYRAMKMSSASIRIMLVSEVAILTLFPFGLGAFAGFAASVGVAVIALEAGALSYFSVIAVLLLTPLIGGAVLLRQSALEAIKGE